MRERWRFLESNEPAVHPVVGTSATHLDSESDDDFTGCCAEAGAATKTKYGRKLLADLDDAEDTQQFKRRKKRLFGPPESTSTTMIEVHGIPPISERWSDPTRWTLISAAPWDDVQEHINVEEARVALMSLRRLCRSVRYLGTTCLTLCDNLCSVLMCEKGRSGVHALNTLCRRAAAYQISGNVQWRLRHVKSEDNVADKPSRQWGLTSSRPADPVG